MLADWLLLLPPWMKATWPPSGAPGLPAVKALPLVLIPVVAVNCQDAPLGEYWKVLAANAGVSKLPLNTPQLAGVALAVSNSRPSRLSKFSRRGGRPLRALRREFVLDAPNSLSRILRNMGLISHKGLTDRPAVPFATIRWYNTTHISVAPQLNSFGPRMSIAIPSLRRNSTARLNRRN